MQNKIKTMAKSKIYERTIEEELFQSWQMLRRTDDATELGEITGKSYPIIYRALNFGHVKDEEVANDISNFYKIRSLKQKQQAREILKNLV